MKFTYYPGCSLKSGGRAYEESFLAVCRALGVELEELADWNCCGATAYMAVDEHHAMTLASRNLAIAERTGRDLVAPCAGCYLVLNKAQTYMQKYPEVGKRVQQALQAVGLACKGTVRVRHPLDVFLNDIGPDALKARTVRPLAGLKIAPYYGCQLVRPYAKFDDQHNPQAMDTLLKAVGAEIVPYPLKTKCCGGSLTGTISEVGLRLVYLLLKEAEKRGAHAIVTVCPLCQFNLEAYQDKVSALHGPVRLPVLYVTQLIGLALGLSPRELGLERLLVPFTMPAAPVAAAAAATTA